MIFLPVAERELRIRARRLGTYGLRVAVALFSMLLMTGMSVLQSQYSSPAVIGHRIFYTFAILAGLFCLLEGARQTADCLSEETREGTLGLLFLADLTALDIVVGKLASASLNSLYGLMAIFPVMAVPLLMGGVTGGEVWRLMLALFNLLLFSLAAGLAVSARSRDQLKAWLGTGALLGIFAAGPPVADEVFFNGRTGFLEWLNPFLNCLIALEPEFGTDPERYWKTLLITHLLAWAFFGFACRRVRRSWREDPGNETPEERFFARLQTRLAPPPTPPSPRPPNRLLAENPVEWLGARTNGTRRYLWLAVILFMGLMLWLGSTNGKFLDSGGFVAFAIGFDQVIKIWVALAACHTFAAARRNGALELLLATPLTDWKIVAGFANALYIVFTPPLLVWAASLYFLPLWIASTSPFAHNDGEAILWVVLMIYQGLVLLDLIALGWLGLWFGLTSAKPHVAVLRTLFMVIGVPWLVLLVPFFGIIAMVLSPVWSIALAMWAQARLGKHFRSILTEQKSMSVNTSWWRPFWNMLPPRRSSQSEA